MEGNAKMDIFCENCPQQFNTMDAYNDHLEVCQMVFQQEVHGLNFEQEDENLLPAE